MMPKIGIIGGTGLYQLNFCEDFEPLYIETNYGEALVQRTIYNNSEIFFMTRHGSGHRLPPHLINYRANIAALKFLGVENILTTAAVGSLRQEILPGSLVIIHQFMDQTRERVGTFYTGTEEAPIVHTDFNTPYCP